jgi:hypothetical protein
MEALDLLKDKLVRTVISRFSVGDTWSLYFRGYWLMAHNIISEDESLLNQWMYEQYPSAKNAIDKEYISKCAILAAHREKEVTGLRLDKVCNLTLEFEEDSKIILPTNEEMVDWQWCLNQSGSNPYRDYLVACFWKGEILINQG